MEEMTGTGRTYLGGRLVVLRGFDLDKGQKYLTITLQLGLTLTLKFYWAAE